MAALGGVSAILKGGALGGCGLKASLFQQVLASGHPTWNLPVARLAGLARWWLRPSVFHCSRLAGLVAQEG